MNIVITLAMLITIITTGSVIIPVASPRVHTQLKSENIGPVIFNTQVYILNFSLAGHDNGTDSLELNFRGTSNANCPCYIYGFTASQYQTFVASGQNYASNYLQFAVTCSDTGVVCIASIHYAPLTESQIYLVQGASQLTNPPSVQTYWLFGRHTWTVTTIS